MLVLHEEIVDDTGLSSGERRIVAQSEKSGNCETIEISPFTRGGTYVAEVCVCVYSSTVVVVIIVSYIYINSSSSSSSAIYI